MYNDVNVGEGFLQTLGKNDDISGFNNANNNKPSDIEDKNVDLMTNLGVANVCESNNINLPRVCGGNFENDGNNHNL